MTLLKGLLLLGWLLITRRSGYLAYRAFYRRAHEGHPWAIGLLTGPLATLCTDYAFATTAATQARLSDRVRALYSGPSLLGYADDVYAKGGQTLSEQQRGLVLPVLGSALAQRAPMTIMEIGTGNGDVVAHLAGLYPQHRYIGIDLSVAVASRKHQRDNLSFVEGYALDLLGTRPWGADLVFASSTFIFFTPAEMAAYLRAFQSAGITDIVLNEPVWSGYHVGPGPSRSAHLEGACWFHNYWGYCQEAGYVEMPFFAFEPYRHPISPRPDLSVALVHARRAR